jgi:hypothetical protein
MLECLYVFGEDLLEEAVVEEERLLVAFLWYNGMYFG